MEHVNKNILAYTVVVARLVVHFVFNIRECRTMNQGVLLIKCNEGKFTLIDTGQCFTSNAFLINESGQNCKDFTFFFLGIV